MQYLMVTSFENHWDKIPNDETFYLKNYLSNNLKQNLIENTETIFIKIDKITKTAIKAWFGKVYEFSINRDSGKIFFKIKVESEIEVPSKYKTCNTQWVILDTNLEVKPITENTANINETKINPDNVSDNLLLPPFFENIPKNSYEEFEDNIFIVLKLIGIHNVHKFDRKDQAGKADGFFIFNNIAVLYDATINPSYITTKEQQIDNYCNQLRANNFSFYKQNYYIGSFSKYVWIITKGNNSNIIRKNGDIEIKEVTVESLKNLFLKRLKEVFITDIEFKKCLDEIEKY